MKHNNPLAKQLNLRNFRRRLVADAYKRAVKRAADKQSEPLVLVQLELDLKEAS